jgi:DNA primase
MFNIQDNRGALLEILISRLPANFIAACEQIRRTIAPHLALCDEEILVHCMRLISLQTNAPSDQAVAEVIGRCLSTSGGASCSTQKGAPQFGPSALSTFDMAGTIARNPALFRSMIDIVQQLGAVGERRNIGTNQLVINSRLLVLSAGGGSQALASKNDGPSGTGKSYTLEACLRIQPSTAYHMISGGSAKSLYNMEDGLQHKVLILAEAEPLASRSGKDSELAYCTRSLLSEGQLKYQRTESIDKQRVTVTVTVPGPTALITTTVHGQLEKQLEDRMFTTHPNTSAKQTARILEQTAAAAAGTTRRVDEQLIEAWQLFHDSLESCEVIVPFAKDIVAYLTAIPQLPSSAHRAFGNILSGIKTVALMHQTQRTFDEQGRLIAEMADYAMVYQLLAPLFVERLGGAQRYTDERVRFIADNGPTTPRAISQQFNIAKPTVSNWLKPLIDEGVLAWCDAHGTDV